MLVPHSEGEIHCSLLKFHRENLERFQRARDNAENAALSRAHPVVATSILPNSEMELEDFEYGPNVPTLESETLEDAELSHRLDMLYRGQVQGEGNRVNEEDFEHEDESKVQDNDDDGLQLPDHYMPSMAEVNRHESEQTNEAGGAEGAESTLPSHRTANNVPETDSLQNPYVRVVHTNGIHHIALVYCGCRGTEDTNSDLMAARLVPTSFDRYRTLFTHAVLDDLRLANLECKTSAYQYFQKLRRLTSPMAPETAPNLYHELRRMSRVWRWMKKLKWAGFGHKARDIQEPAAGELANFCPACPQPEINLPEKWEDDSQRWVYRRFFVADGNFKADHVRRHGPTGDVWLSPGGGMMSKDGEYKDFLKTASEMATVSGR
jgi:hypothetical protein